MALLIPADDVSDWHIAIRVSLFPGAAKLYGYTYAFAAYKKGPTRQLFSPRLIARPESDWETLQNLEQAIDILTKKILN